MRSWRSEQELNFDPGTDLNRTREHSSAKHLLPRTSNRQVNKPKRTRHRTRSSSPHGGATHEQPDWSHCSSAPHKPKPHINRRPFCIHLLTTPPNPHKKNTQFKTPNSTKSANPQNPPHHQNPNGPRCPRRRLAQPRQPTARRASLPQSQLAAPPRRSIRRASAGERRVRERRSSIADESSAGAGGDV